MADRSSTARCFLTLPLALFTSMGCGAPPVQQDGATRPDAAADTNSLPPRDTSVPPPVDGSSSDASSDDAALDVMSPPNDARADAAPAGVAMFVAQGYMGRTTISCDDGRTWVADRSDDDAIRCFSDAMTDCDHNGGRAMGMAFGDGWFVGTWGWGRADSVRRSRDGVAWERVIMGTVFSGLEYGAGRFVAFANTPRVSTNQGATWQTAMPIGFMGHIRRTGFAGYMDGRFIAAGAENGAADGEVMYSADGLAWRRPTTIPAPCGVGINDASIAYGRNTIVLGHGNGTICRSTDGGATWTMASAGGELGAFVIYTGSEFVTWGTRMGARVRFRSTDGATWTTDATRTRQPDGTMGNGPDLGAVARSETTGTFVASNGGWQQWYDRQMFFRSADGITWEALPRTSFRGSHPIRFIAFGAGMPSAMCR